MSNSEVLPEGLLQGNTADISGTNLRNWVVNNVFAAAPKCRVVDPSSTMFEWLTFDQYLKVQNRLSAPLWTAWCLQNHQSVGTQVVTCEHDSTVTGEEVEEGVDTTSATNIVM
eukprot:gene40847-50543_t